MYLNYVTKFEYLLGDFLLYVIANIVVTKPHISFNEGS